MREQRSTNARLTMVWVPVTGQDGRVRMESRWVAPAVAKPHAA